MLPRFLVSEQIKAVVNGWDRTYLGPSRGHRLTEGVQVFRHRVLEALFGTSHPVMPFVWFGPPVVLCWYLSFIDPRFAWGPAMALFAAGWLGWSLIEYLLHRFYFHLVPVDEFDAKFNAFVVHGYHHEFPNDRLRLVAPPVLSWPIGAVLAGLHYLAAGPYYGLLSFAGTAVGYLAYDWVHYYTHHSRPTTRLGKAVRRYHMHHHYKDSTSHYGISSPLWDHVFGTVDRARAPRSSSQSDAA